MTKMQDKPASQERNLGDLLFVAFNSRIAAMDRYTGEIVWEWKSPKGSGFVSLLLDGDRLMASVNGYTNCIDPLYGQTVWNNNMKGFGLGTPSLASIHGSTSSDAAAKLIADQQAAAAASGG